MLETLIDTPIETRDAIVYGALALILLLLLRISSRLRRIIRLIEPKRERPTAPGQPNFTGAFVGMACQDMAGTALPADFDWFDYRERDFRVDPSID